MIKRDKAETVSLVAGCILWAIIISFIAMSLHSRHAYLNKLRARVETTNNILDSQQFEVKAIYTRQSGNKPANTYIAHECILENINTKERVIARFDASVPLVGDVWKIRMILHGEQMLYILQERVR